MQFDHLEHILRASAAISKCRDFVIVGSQAIVASFPNAPAALLVSMEADIYPLDKPELADLVDGSIGEKSDFHNTFGYYARGVAPETAILPAGWQSRLVKLETPNTGGAVGWCLSPADIAISKLAAGREKDLDYVAVLLSSGCVRAEEVEALIPGLPEATAELVTARLLRATRCRP